MACKFSFIVLLILLIYENGQRAETFDNLRNSVRIAMVGKYVGMAYSYLSMVKALLHACIAYSLKRAIEWIAASDLEDDSAKTPEAHVKAWRTKGAGGAFGAVLKVEIGVGVQGVTGTYISMKMQEMRKSKMSLRIWMCLVL